MIVKYIRPVILVISLILALLIYGLVKQIYHTADLQNIRLVECYALSALAFLYLSVLPGPLYRVFPYLPFRVQFVKARRALGVSAFFFALLHATLALFTLLGGPKGLFYLGSNYLIAISFSFTALLILAAMAATSFDAMVHKLGRHWKQLHRLVYVAGTFILIHAVMLGSQFLVLTNLIPEIVFAAVAFLVILEAICTDRLLAQRFGSLPRFSFSVLITMGVIIIGIMYLYFPAGSNGVASLGIHAQHIALAQQAQQGNIPGGINSALSANIPGLNGDRTLRYTVSFLPPATVNANQDVQLKFKVYNAATGNAVQLFTPVYTKLMHLVIVNQELDYFAHIHPDFDGNEFVVTTQFPKDDLYHLYIDFQPIGGIEQQFGFTIPVGAGTQVKQSTIPADNNLTKTFGNYQITMQIKGTPEAAAMSVGQVPFDFTIVNAQTKQPVTTLKPYLGAFGHLTMVNEKTYEYIHVHPTTITQPPPDANGGPTVEFLPLGLYGAIKPGTYRVYAEFNPDNNLTTADFTITVQ